MPEGTHRLAAGFGTNADSHLLVEHLGLRLAFGVRRPKPQAVFSSPRSNTPKPRESDENQS